MKQALVILVLLLTSLCFAAEETINITIEGMTCGGCVKKVTQTLKDIDGVKTADVKLKPGSACVVIESGKTNSDALINSVAALGYKVSTGAKTVGEATHCKDEAHHAKGALLPPSAKPEAAEKNVAKVSLAVKGEPPTAAKPIGKKSCAKTCSATMRAKCGAVSAEIKPVIKPHGEGHVCPTNLNCKELNAFHEAMHPMHMALKSADFETIRAGYPMLAQKAEALEKLDCAEACKIDKKKFDKKRKNLIKKVAKLGKVVRGDNDKKLAKEFDKMHDAYVELGNLCGEHH